MPELPAARIIVIWYTDSNFLRPQLTIKSKMGRYITLYAKTIDNQIHQASPYVNPLTIAANQD